MFFVLFFVFLPQITFLGGVNSHTRQKREDEKREGEKSEMGGERRKEVGVRNGDVAKTTEVEAKQAGSAVISLLVIASAEKKKRKKRDDHSHGHGVIHGRRMLKKLGLELLQCKESDD